MGQALRLEGSPYVLTFKEYFPNFILTKQGPVTRSSEPRNPAVAFVLSGPEGTDAHLLFAFHPEIPALHGWQRTIRARVGYTHPAKPALPPQAIALIRLPDGQLAAVLTGAAGERQVTAPLAIGTRYTHPWLGYQFQVTAAYPRARVARHFTNRGNEVRAQAIRVTVREGDATASEWVPLHGAGELSVGGHPLLVEYRPAERELPVAIKLLDFRKIDYPGTEMAAGFESDVELTDPHRGLLLIRTIRMNHPLRYRGFSFYQSSYIPGPPETTVLSVRSDPGTPFVYAGFLIVALGIVSMFITRQDAGRPPAQG
jgi:hypothetical protein